MSSEVRMISIDQIRDDLYPSRVVQDNEEFRELVGSIRVVGILNPLVLVQASDGELAVVAGHRRFAGAKAAGLAVVPARVIAGDPDLLDRIRFDENKHRQDLSATEEGRLFRRMIAEGRLTVRAVAFAVGQSESYVQSRLSLLEADEEIIDAVDKGRISFSVARELAGIPGRTRRLFFLKYAYDGGATTRTVAKWRADCEAERVAEMQREELRQKVAAGELGPVSDEVRHIVDTLPTTGQADEYGWFTCSCNRRAQVMTARYVNGEWICGDCVAVMRAEQEAGLRGPCCPGCGLEVPAARRRMISLCQGCYDEIQRAIERTDVPEEDGGLHGDDVGDPERRESTGEADVGAQGASGVQPL